MSTQHETFEDIDLEDAHTNDEPFINKPQMIYQPSTQPEHSIHNHLLASIKPLLPLLNKFKNTILMIPALFIFCIVFFVSYCTLFLAIPYRLYSSSQNGEFIAGILSLMFALLFITSALLTITSFTRCVFTSSAVSDNPPSMSSQHINNETCRRCSKCTEFKPSRAHHCSICSSCILKMDHHCPWVSNCVGYFNYKYFCLFIWFATVSCHLSSLICFSQLFTLFQHSKQRDGSMGYNGVHSSWMMINSLLTLAFGMTLTCFGFFHLVLVLKGSTTIEFGSDGYAPYNLGWKRNWQSIFGSNIWLWFLPVPTMKGDGYEYVKCDEDNRGLLDDSIECNVYHHNLGQDQRINHNDDSLRNEDNDNDQVSDFSSDLTS